MFGYLRPSYCYTPLTMYQLVHSKFGYDVLKDKYKIQQTPQPNSNVTITTNESEKVGSGTSSDREYKTEKNKKMSFCNVKNT